MNQKLKGLFLLLIVSVSAKAQIENGKVYNFVNVGNATKSMVIASNNGVTVTDTDTDDYNQLWYVSRHDDGSYSLRNLGSGRYLRSSNASSVRWTMVKEVEPSCKFSCVSLGSNYYSLLATNSPYGEYGSHYMHYGENQNTVVCWSADAAATQWTISEVSVDRDVLDANWNALVGVDPSTTVIAGYQTALRNLFSDDACTTLKKAFASENAVKGDADYNALPTALQNMVLKVYNGSWAEDNYNTSKAGWGSDYAKKYRVQLYEPYNEPEAAAAALGINAHTNLNNPTGIFANEREAIYVMVGGDIEEGASLYLASYAGNDKPGGYTDGVELKKGLNVIPSFTDGNNYVINYVVHTFDSSNGKKGNAAKACKLSDYDALKIHIEGGHINGYWNKVGDELYTPDTNADWEYIEARATQTTVTVLGEYITLQFPLRDEDAVDNKGERWKGLAYYLNQLKQSGKGVKEAIDEWDNVMMWERFLLGLLDKAATTDVRKNVKSPYSTSAHVIEYTGEDGDAFATDYSDYYNVHGLSLGVGYNYMYGGWDHCGYHYNTMQSIIVDILTNAGSHWGPGHEIGHQHQTLLNLNGLTEVTNNLFSNVVLWYFGETTSRVNGDQGSLSNVLAAFNARGSDFYTNNIWAQTHLYYKLFLYYHVLGHNPKFYPRLFEMLRQDPMVNGANIDGATSLLHFYKKCCLASGDDLTEFFRAYGFFRVMNNRLVGDYSNATYNMSQKDIDEAIAEVKALGYDENLSVLFINDATGEAIESHKGDKLDLYGETTICAELGSYASFADQTTPDYTYCMMGNTITMAGSGGVGFAVFNEANELIAFSDKKNFQISDVCTAALESGKASVMVVKGDNTMVSASDVMDTDDSEAKHIALGDLLTSVAELFTYLDTDNTKPGFYKASALETLQELYEKALRVHDSREENSYKTIFSVLSQEYIKAISLDTDKTPILPGSTYVLTNKKHSTQAMTLTANGMMGVYDTKSSSQQWTFEATDEKDVYYLRNGSSNYLGSLLKSSQVGVTTRELASRYKLYDLGEGLWALQCQNDSKELMSLHCDDYYKIVGWSHTSAEDDGSWWYLTATNIDESMLPLCDLQDLIAKTENLVDEMAIVQRCGTIDMSTCAITSNATETGHETHYLTDGDPSTFFHTKWQGTVISEYHNIVIDLGAQRSLTEFALNYKTLPTSATNVDAPTRILVMGSNDGSSYSSIATLSSGLPTEKGKEYTSATLGHASEAYRYIRLQVTNATGGKLGWTYYYFGLAELNLIRMSTLVEAISDKYENFITVSEIEDIYNQLDVAQQKCNTGSVTAEDVEAMEELYNQLYAAYNNANNGEFNAKKEGLLTLIDNTNSLINSCGTVTYTPENYHEVLALQTTDPTGYNYLSTNAPETHPDEAELLQISHLIDKDNSTYFHSAWSWAVGAAHHLKVDLGNGKSLKEFTFTYTTGKRPFPYEIKVYGSNNDVSYTHLATFSRYDSGNRLPTTEEPIDNYRASWTSSTISSDMAYRYLRFDVTNSGGKWSNANPKGEYCFSMSNFGVTAINESESYTVELGNDVGDVTEELLLATYKATLEAQAVVNSAFTKEQLQEAYDRLRAQRKALYEAKYMCIEYTISVIGANGNGGIAYDGEEYTETLSLPESFDMTLLEAIALEGYNPGVVTIDEETDIITVSYTVDKSAWAGLIEEIESLITSCSIYVNSQYVTEELLAEVEAEISEAQEQCDNVASLADYEAAKRALQMVKNKLSSAINSAEEEVAAREGLLQVLSTLIADVEALIPSCGVISPEGAIESMNPNGSVTEAQLLTVYNAVNAAKELNNTAANATIESVTVELQRLYDALGTALNTPQLPVILTTDMENPVLYVINSKRGAGMVLQYDPADGHMFSVAASDGSAKQVFYFTVGDTRTQVYIHPFAAGGQVLAANNTVDGDAKVFVREKGVCEYEQWTFVARANACYNIKPVGTSTYFSHFGAGDNKMGFYASYPSSDAGSLFTLAQTTIEGNGAYHSLQIYHDEVAMRGWVGGTAPGYYPEAQIAACNDAYESASAYLDDTATYAQYLEAYQALRGANEALAMNKPEEGKFYVLRSVTKNALAYANPIDGKMYWSTDMDASEDAAIWMFTESDTDGFYHIKNVFTDTYMNVFADKIPSSLSVTAGEMEIVSLSGDGQVGIKCNGTMMHVQSDGAVVHWDTGANGGSAWRIEEVSDVTSIDTVIINDNAAIYDLYGRRIVKVVASGLYIIDGKKRYIQAK